jgi:molecular chaperone GrpE
MSKKTQVEEEIKSAIESIVSNEMKKEEQKKEAAKKEEQNKEGLKKEETNTGQIADPNQIAENAAKPEDKDAKIRELTDMLQRLQAEYLNYKNRTERETRQLLEYASSDLVRKLLPILDTFELALKNSQDAEKFKEGMNMLHLQFLDVLRHEGLKKIEAKGKKFDPYKHEVLMKQSSDAEEDMVLEELQKGYQVKDKVIRHSKVMVSAGKKQ